MILGVLERAVNGITFSTKKLEFTQDMLFVTKLIFRLWFLKGHGISFNFKPNKETYLLFHAFQTKIQTQINANQSHKLDLKDCLWSLAYLLKLLSHQLPVNH